MKSPLYQFITWFVLCTITVGFNSCSDKEPAPEKVCKLLTNGYYQTTYEYDGKYNLVRLSGNGGSTTYTYDKKGFLTEEIRSDGKAIKYEYKNGLLSKITYPAGSLDIETIYEYDTQQKLSKYTHKTTRYTIILNYNNGKQISYFRNEDGTITQPFQYDNGRVIRIIQGDRSYQTYDYDSRGRNTLYTKYDNTGKITEYIEYTYQDGLEPLNAIPNNFFKGFPDEIKNISPNGLIKQSTYYKRQANNSFIKESESNYGYVLNRKGYPTVVSQTFSYRNSTGTWVTNNTSKTTYSYFNCEE
ncbi:hypothetical protein [Runella limosa]|uniref:hypothetical protein n=1 Tax=Runella limosa TaxID=370978 RepID=UPI000427553D|nr:hypothetical protein [Runella limosa]